MSNRTGIPRGEVIAVLEELLNEGVIKGHLTSDGERFFRHDAKVSEKPGIPGKLDEPAFMSYDTRMARFVASIGLIIVLIGLAIVSIAADFVMQNIAAAILLVGTALLLGGCYHIGRRKAP
ncbi:MAG: hypothetical protein ACFFAY_09910 [Promethearchaeota archaeon]